MTGYPVVLDGTAFSALVVGGGAVATRKVRGLLDAGVRVRVVAPEVTVALRELADSGRIELIAREFVSGDVGGALLVIAATSDRTVNARVAEEAHQALRLVNVADESAEGNCATLASHRSGELLVSVYAGGVPTAASRIRDALAERFGDAYADALSALASLRARLLAGGDSRSWQRARVELLGADFCASVENGAFEERVARWR